jgi:hypothetical protein
MEVKMIEKKVICPDRLRRIPRQFSWVDHRVVRNNYIRTCDHAALAFYLLLVTVSDAKGLSYYSDTTVGKLLSLDEESVGKARAQLIKAKLIAYKRPIYQVLSLDLREDEEDYAQERSDTLAKRSGANGPVSIKEIILGTTGGNK